MLTFFFDDILSGDSKLIMVIIEGLELMLRYTNSNKLVMPELNGKLKYMKEKVKPNINIGS